MGKRIMAILLASTMAVGMATTAYAVEASAEAADTASITIAEENPIDVAVDALDKHTYGGIYYDENDVLHIIPVSGYESVVAQSVNAPLTRANQAVVIDNASAKKTVYSMAELEEAQKYLLDNLEEFGIIGVGFNGEANALAVYLDDGDESTIMAASPVKNIIFRDGDMLKFSEKDEAMEPVDNDAIDTAGTARLTVKGGQRCTSASGTYFSTIATSAVYDYGGPNETTGFLTCGHGWSIGDSIYVNGVYLGEVMTRKQSGDADYAFIASSYNSNGYMTNGDRLTGRQDPTTGMSVKCYAAVSGIQSGEFLDTDISGSWGTNGVSYDFYDLFSTDISTINGDSGAAFAHGSNIVGIMKGATDNTYQNSVGVKIENIANYDVLPSK